MKDVTEKNFGVIIAFLLPGFILLWGVSYSSPLVADWLARSSDAKSATIGGFLYSSLTSLALGLIISAVRWALIDHLMRAFGIKDPGIDFSHLADKDKAAAFHSVVENHYRYYQYYANTLVALLGAVVAAVLSSKNVTWQHWVIVGLLAIILLWGSGDALKKYYDRAYKALS